MCLPAVDMVDSKSESQTFGFLFKNKSNKIRTGFGTQGLKKKSHSTHSSIFFLSQNIPIKWNNIADELFFGTGKQRIAKEKEIWKQPLLSWQYVERLMPFSFISATPISCRFSVTSWNPKLNFIKNIFVVLPKTCLGVWRPQVPVKPKEFL